MLGDLKPGDKILTHYSLYGGTEELISKVLPTLGITAVITDLRQTDQVDALLKQDKSIRMLYLETPAQSHYAMC
jgi:methionine-gamma-lyase